MENHLSKDQRIIESVEEALSDELLEALIGMKTYKKLKKHRQFNLADLKYISEDEVEYLTDMEKVKVFALKEILKRGLPSTEKFQISSPKTCYEHFKNLKNLEQLKLVLVTLNIKNVILSEKTIFEGTLGGSTVHPREIFKEAVKKSAANIILVLNHPSGQSQPSKCEMNFISNIDEVGKMMGIELLDCIIIGDNEFYSFKEERTTVIKEVGWNWKQFSEGTYIFEEYIGSSSYKPIPQN